MILSTPDVNNKRAPRKDSTAHDKQRWGSLFNIIIYK